MFFLVGFDGLLLGMLVFILKGFVDVESLVGSYAAKGGIRMGSRWTGNVIYFGVLIT